MYGMHCLLYCKLTRLKSFSAASNLQRFRLLFFLGFCSTASVAPNDNDNAYLINITKIIIVLIKVIILIHFLAS